jgi:hypothetical protein
MMQGDDLETHQFPGESNDTAGFKLLSPQDLRLWLVDLPWLLQPFYRR